MTSPARKRRLSALFAALMAVPVPIVVVSPPAVAAGTTRYVAASGSVGTGQSCASPGYVGATEVSIQAAIDASSAGDTVFVCAGTYAISPRLTITKNLTFEGAGEQLTILDGGSTSQLLYLPDQNPDITVSISDFTFQNGGANTRNGGECNLGANCGGAIFAGGGTRFHVSDSYFTGNQAMFGGAIAVVGAYENVASTISRSTFESNRTTIDGGAILVLANYGLVMDRITVVNNSIVSGENPRAGVGLVVNFGGATMKNSTVVNNSTRPGSLSTSTIYVNGSFDIQNSILANNNDVPLCVSATSQRFPSIANGNLLTDSSCVVSQVYPPATTGESSVVDFEDLKLGTLSYRGYLSKTVPLLAGSAAINYHSNSCSGADQIGSSVPEGPRCDTGAYERPANQGVNTPTGWTYPSASIDRGYSSTMSVATPAVDPAGRGVDYASSTPGVCSIDSSGRISATANGTCTVTATGPGWLTRDESSISRTVTVTQTPASSTTTTTTTTVPASTTTTVAPATTTAPATTVAGDATTSATATTVAASTGTGGQTGTGTESSTRTVTAAPADTADATVTPSTSPATTTTTLVPAPDAPDAAPGEAGATIDGQSIETQLSRSDNGLVITAGSMSATVYGESADGERIALDADGNLQLDAGDRVVVEGAGFEPDSVVDIWLFSTPTRLGDLVASGAGSVSGSFPVPATIEAGSHRLVLEGTTSDGKDAVIGVGLYLGDYATEGGINRWLIIVPLVMATILGLVIPTTVRRRRALQLNA